MHPNEAVISVANCLIGHSVNWNCQQKRNLMNNSQGCHFPLEFEPLRADGSEPGIEYMIAVSVKKAPSMKKLHVMILNVSSKEHRL
jgi:uncharacterized membrane protein